MKIKLSYTNVSLQLFILSFFVMAGCSDSDDEEQSFTSNAAAAAVASIFSSASSNDSSSSTILLGASILGPNGSNKVCDNLYSGPRQVLMFGTGISESTTYGSATDSITVTPEDMCEDDDGTALTGDATNAGGNRFAYFTLVDTVSASCSNSERSGTLEMAQGTGVTRNTDEYTEIYGQFNFGDASVKCTLRLDSSGALVSSVSSCTDFNSGEPTLISSDFACTFDTGSALALPSTIQGHFALSTDEGRNAAYDCFATYPIGRDDSGYITITSDCDGFSNYNFNLSSFNIEMVVNSSGEFFLEKSPSRLANHIKLMHKYGYPLYLSFSIVYQANYTDGAVFDDTGAEFPQALVDDASFRETLATHMYDAATYAEILKVEMFSPLSETDRVFRYSSETNAASLYMQGILPDLTSRYSGALMWVGQFFNSTSSGTHDFTGFDYAGLNLSPVGDQIQTAFGSYAATQLGNLATLANAQGVPFMISNAGIWGSALTSTVFDWDLNSDRVLSAFEIMYDASVIAGTDHIIFWEGAENEVVFESYPNVSQYIANLFGGDASAF